MHPVMRLAIQKVGIRLLLVFYLFGGSNLSSQEISVTWIASEEEDVSGYKVYYGKASRQYRYCIHVGLSTDCTIPALPDSGTFYFAVTAYDTAGNESDYSEEISLWNPIPPNQFFTLMANYPNPFNPKTRVPFYVARTLSVTLAVYDVLGRQVKILDRGEKEVGRYEVEWDGTDMQDVPVANGMYFIRLVVGNFSQTRKLILIR